MNENNILIAEFLGYKQSLLQEWINPNDKPNEDGFKPIYFPNGSEFKFDTDWNQLMKVVDKIETITGDFRIVNNVAIIDGDDNEGVYEYAWKIEGSSKIDACYKMCIKFIKYYNEKRK